MALPKTIGRYEILEELGRGSMGVVFKARDPRIGRIVALKAVAFSFPLGPGEEDEFLKRFYDEAEIAGRLSHPNIVTIYDVGERGPEGERFIAMEYVTGTNLHDLLASGARLPVMQVADVVEQVAGALDYAHENGIVHRDIKPANIVLTDSGQVKILDFGIARWVSAEKTGPGRFFGTPNYMAPEQVTGGEIDGRADQFALAVTLYQLLTGERPFLGDSITAVSYQVVNIEPAPPSKLNPSLSPSFDRLLRRALAKNSSERYTCCKDLAADLKSCATAWQEGTEQSMPPTLVSRRDTSIPTSAPGQRGYRRPQDGAMPAWSRLLYWRSSRKGIGWLAFGLCLALLATAPYLFRRAPVTPNGVGPFALVQSPWGPEPPTEIDGSVTAGAPAPATERPKDEVAISNAELALILRHRMKSGHLTVRVDGDQALAEEIHGDGGKGHWSGVITVPAGRRRVEIRLRNDSGSMDDIDGIDIDFRPHEKRVLRLSVGAITKRLRLRLEGQEKRDS